MSMIGEMWEEDYNRMEAELKKQLEEKDKLIEKLRKNIAALSEYAEIDVNEDGEPIY